MSDNMQQLRHDSYVMPCRILKSEGVLNAKELLNDTGIQPRLIEYDGANQVPSCTTIQDGGYVLLDFGTELCGGINLSVQWVLQPKTRINIVFGESAMEALADLGEKCADNAHGYRNMTVPAIDMSSLNYGHTGFRFAKIQVHGGAVIINGIKAHKEMRELEYKGFFECDDELLNKIWKTGAYTVALNMHEYLWDGIKRDRLVWIGDMHPAVSTVAAVFGEDASVVSSLDFNTKYTPPEKWLNGIATYSMWWILIQYKWYMHFGNIEYLAAQSDYLIRLVKHIMDWNELVSSDAFGDMEGFVDWSSYGDRWSEEEGRKSILCMCLECAADILDVLGIDEIAKKCRCYVNQLRSERITEPSNKRVSALTVLSGRDCGCAKKMLAGNSAEEMSCFMGYYILLAKAKLGDYNDALDIIRKYWGGMLEMGATSFWEDFDIKWMVNSARIDEITPEGKKDIHGDFGRFCYQQFRHSLCHSWASGPTPFLSEQIGGIEILEPGCKKVRVSPHMGNLKWIRVEYPTPAGNIKIYATQTNGVVKVQINAPDEIEIIR